MDTPSADRETLFVQLGQMDVVDIIGVIEPSGVGGVGSRDGSWTLSFSLPAWKYFGGAVRTQGLTVRKPVNEEEIKPIMQSLPPYAVVHLKARVAEDAIPGGPHALLVEIIGLYPSDQDLNECAQKLQEPVAFEDPLFGTFKLNRRVDWYETSATWGTLRVRLTVPAAKTQDALSIARELWQSPAEWQSTVSTFAADRLLSLKNDYWLDEDESEVTAEEFKRRMVLESICIDGSGFFEFWYNDGELFWGHSILVNGDLTDGPIQAEIAG